MNRQFIRIFLLTSLILGSSLMTTGLPRAAHGASDPVPVIGVWSTACSTFNITLAGCPSISLTTGATISVQINVTSASPYNAFETILFYDPSILNATLIDLTGSSALGTRTVWTNPYSVVSQTKAQAGAVIISMANLAQTPITNDGILANINFTVRAAGVSPLTLAAGMAQPSGNAISLGGVKPDWTRLVLGGTPYDTATADGYFMNQVAHRGPVAVFSYSPIQPLAGQTVTFNGGASYDLENPSAGSANITHFYWDFGDGSNGVDSPLVQHIFAPRAGAAYIGNFSVRLTVADKDDNFTGMITQRIYVAPPPLHDVGIVGMSSSPTSVNVGGKVTITVTLLNKGTFDENFNLTVTYRTPPIQLGFNQSSIAIGGRDQFSYSVDTTGLSVGSYQVTAVVKIPVANNTSDETQSVIFTVNNPGSQLQLLYVAVGAVAIIAVIAITVLFLRRRRRPE